jgi:L-lactate permease
MRTLVIVVLLYFIVRSLVVLICNSPPSVLGSVVSMRQSVLMTEKVVSDQRKNKFIEKIYVRNTKRQTMSVNKGTKKQQNGYNDFNSSATHRSLKFAYKSVEILRAMAPFEMIVNIVHLRRNAMKPRRALAIAHVQYSHLYLVSIGRSVGGIENLAVS